MNIKVNQKSDNNLKFGCLLYSEYYDNKYHVVRSYEVQDFPVGLLDLETNEVFDCYASLDVVLDEYSEYTIYQPNEITMEIGNNK